MTAEARQHFDSPAKAIRGDEHPQKPDDAATTVLRASNGAEYLCHSEACEMVVRVTWGESVGDHEQMLECQTCNRLFEFPSIERQPESGRLFKLIDRARKGDKQAKDAWWAILETERRPTILKKLTIGGVRQDDLPDAHHQVGMKIYDKIELLIATHAYFKFELRIINEISRKWRLNYWREGEPLDLVLTEVQKSNPSNEAFYE
jgi:hypothetical protein